MTRPSYDPMRPAAPRFPRHRFEAAGLDPDAIARLSDAYEGMGYDERMTFAHDAARVPNEELSRRYSGGGDAGPNPVMLTPEEIADQLRMDQLRQAAKDANVSAGGSKVDIAQRLVDAGATGDLPVVTAEQAAADAAGQPPPEQPAPPAEPPAPEQPPADSPAEPPAPPDTPPTPAPEVQTAPPDTPAEPASAPQAAPDAAAAPTPPEAAPDAAADTTAPPAPPTAPDPLAPAPEAAPDAAPADAAPADAAPATAAPADGPTVAPETPAAPADGTTPTEGQTTNG